jgi:Holliday junction resolvase RusA-like endonuclease
MSKTDKLKKLGLIGCIKEPQETHKTHQKSTNSCSCVETVEEVFGSLKTPPKKNLNTSHELYLKIKAVPWAAPRISKHGVQDLRAKDKQWVRWLVKEQWVGPVLTCPLEVRFYFGFKAKKIGPFHTKKPDVDNIVKLFLDTLKKTVMLDDNLVFKISAEKYYSSDDHVRIVIIEH